MQLMRVPNDQQYRMHCPVCGEQQTKFRVGGLEVEVRSVASAMPMISIADGTYREFKKGHVESVSCAKCGAIYRPEDAHSTT